MLFLFTNSWFLFISSTCEEKNECLPDPCEHGGVCIDLIDDFVCNCTVSILIGNLSIFSFDLAQWFYQHQGIVNTDNYQSVWC